MSGRSAYYVDMSKMFISLREPSGYANGTLRIARIFAKEIHFGDLSEAEGDVASEVELDSDEELGLSTVMGEPDNPA